MARYDFKTIRPQALCYFIHREGIDVSWVIFQTTQSEPPTPGIQGTKNKFATGNQALSCLGNKRLTFFEILEDLHTDDAIEPLPVEIHNVTRRRLLNAPSRCQSDRTRIPVDQCHMMPGLDEQAGKSSTTAPHVQDALRRLTDMVEQKVRFHTRSVSSDTIGVSLWVLQIPKVGNRRITTLNGASCAYGFRHDGATLAHERSRVVPRLI